jgi:uncharacterized membrane protein YccF (DUF307 family)
MGYVTVSIWEAMKQIKVHKQYLNSSKDVLLIDVGGFGNGFWFLL